MNRWLKAVATFVIAGLCACVLAAVAGASPGDVDRSFGKNGTVVVKPDPPHDTVLRDFIEAPEGRMLAVGSSGKTNHSGVLVRYLPSGRLDRSFGNNGVVLSPKSGWARAVMQGDGKIVTFGRIGHEPAIARFDETGKLDTSFGSDGTYVAKEIRPLFPEPADTLEFIGPGIDSHGRIVAIAIPYGCRFPEQSRTCLNMSLFRFTPDGQPDISFGEGSGLVLAHVGLSPNYRPGLVALAPDDSIVVRSVPRHRVNYGGGVNENYVGVLEKFDPTGRRDESFGTDGRFVYGHSESDEGEVLFDADGDMTVVHDGVLKIDAGGNPDPDFGANGFADILHSGGTSGIGVVSAASGHRLANGSMLLSGASSPYSERFAYAIRMKADGTRDPTYSNDGLGISPIGQRMPTKARDTRRGLSYAGAILGPRGKVTVAATGRFGGEFAFVLTRFLGGTTKQKLSCSGKPATIYGTSGPDKLYGGPKSVTAALGGDDEIRSAGTVCGAGGDDQINLRGKDAVGFAGAGNDRIRSYQSKVIGGPGKDDISSAGGQVEAGSGNDRLKADGGLVRAGSGDDAVRTGGSRAWGGSGDDHIVDLSSYGKSSLHGNSGSDTIRGGDGIDRIDGGTGDDRLSGGKAADRILGRLGADNLKGGAGSDTLIGGPGLDRLDGGPVGPNYEIYGVHNKRARGKVKIIGNRVRATNLRVWMKCSGYTTHPVRSGFNGAWMFDELDFKPSGRFGEDVDFYDGFGQNVDGWMEGHRTNRKIVVRYALEDDFSYGEDGAYHCQAGNPYGINGRRHGVRFVLKRRPNQSQVVIQGRR